MTLAVGWTLNTTKTSIPLLFSDNCCKRFSSRVGLIKHSCNLGQNCFFTLRKTKKQKNLNNKFFSIELPSPPPPPPPPPKKKKIIMKVRFCQFLPLNATNFQLVAFYGKKERQLQFIHHLPLLFINFHYFPQDVTIFPLKPIAN